MEKEEELKKLDLKMAYDHHDIIWQYYYIK